jgi:hypothetical protein
VDLAMVANSKTDLAPSEKSRLIEEGLQHLTQALVLKPDYDEAMATLGLLYQQRAGIVNSAQEKSSLEHEAASWLAKSLASRKKAAEEKQNAK